MPEPETPEPLERLLDRWGNETPAPPGPLAAEVWRRIEHAQTAMPQGWARVHAVFARPSFAAMFVAACMLLGLFLAEMRVSRLRADQAVQLAHDYLRLVDPLLGDANASATPTAHQP